MGTTCDPRLFFSNSAVFQQQLDLSNAFRNGTGSVNIDEQKQKKVDALKRKIQGEKTDTFPPDVTEYFKTNPNHYGLPRTFSILIGGHNAVSVAGKLHDSSLFSNEGHAIRFSAFGRDNQGLWINNTWIPPAGVKLAADKMIYTFKGDLHERDGGGTIHGYFNFLSSPSSGLLILNNNDVYAIQLQPYATTYSLSVSANAGASFSSGENELSWDVNSDEWKNATWESKAGAFAFAVVENDDPITPIQAVEIGITDEKSSPPSVAPVYDFGLPAHDAPLRYTAIFQENADMTNYLQIKISDSTLIPPPPLERAASPVPTLFPQRMLVSFDGMGETFVGAYMDLHLNAYGIKGQHTPSSILSQHSFVVPAFAPTESRPRSVIPSEVPASQPTAFPEAGIQPQTAHETPEASPHFSSVLPVKGPFPTLSSASSDLNLTDLLNLSPMLRDAGGQWYDAPAKTVLKDIESGILTFMDEDLYNAFVGGSRPTLSPEIRSILCSDPVGNAKFYKSLQVPFLVVLLSTSTKPAAKYLNGARAAKVLQEIPANDPIYQAQNSALYAFRWRQMYPVIDDFLSDQLENDYSEKITAAASELKQKLAEQAEGIPDPNGEIAKSLVMAQKETDDLKEWALANNLYWAFMLMYYTETYYLPYLQLKMSSGRFASEVAMELKTLGAVFGILEGSQINPNGKTFQANFNEMVRAFILTVVLPQFIDVERNSLDIIDIMRGIISMFSQTYRSSDDPTIWKTMDTLSDLVADEDTVDNFMHLFNAARSATATFTSWAVTVATMQTLTSNDAWYKKLANGQAMLDTFLLLMASVSIILPLIPGAWSTSASSHKNTTRLGLTPRHTAIIVAAATKWFLVVSVKFVQGLLRLDTFYDDIASWTSGLKVFIGDDELINNFAQQALEIQSEFTRWLIHTTKDSMRMCGPTVTLGTMIFGKNATEFLAKTVGSVMGLVNLALTAWDLATSDDPLRKVVDSLKIVSTSLSIIGIAAGFITSGIASVDLTSIVILQMVSTMMGPLSLVFAEAGFVTMIALVSVHEDPPGPLTIFAEGRAKDAGLFMDNKTAVDYFQIIPPDGPTTTSYDGLSFVHDSKCLRISQSTGNLFQAPVGLAPKMSYFPDSCLNVDTDADGLTTVWTDIRGLDDKIHRVCLAVGADNIVVALPPPDKALPDANDNMIPVDPAIYAKQQKQQQWEFVGIRQGASIEVKEVTYLQSSTFSIRSVSTNKYLSVDLASSTIKLALIPSDWFCAMQPIAPSKFAYLEKSWALYTTSRDEFIAPLMEIPGSQPLQWSISPPPPPGLQLETQVPNGGLISIMPGRSPYQTPLTTYTVTASMVINGAKFSQTTQVGIEVKSPSMTSLHFQYSAAHLPSEQTHDRVSDMVSAVGDAAFFDFVQLPTPFEEHHVTLMVLNYLVSKLDRRWSGMASVNDDKHLSLPPEVLARPPNLGSVFTHDPGFFIEALMVKALYNRNRFIQSWIDVGRTEEGLTGLTQEFYMNAAAFYAAYLQKRFQITPSPEAAQQYLQLLLFSPWRAIRKAEFAQGGWKHASLEMYLQCVKYRACGAVDAEIEKLLQELTVTEPKLNPGAFADITGTTWQQYRGWIIAGAFDGSMIDPKKLDRMGPHDNVNTRHIQDFVRQTPFLKHHGGSCFTGNTLVVMQDGRLERIDRIRAEDEVQSRLADGTAGSRKVAFVSTPRRGSRALYAVDGSEWLVTATHPMISKEDGQTITFIDADLARASNPTWLAFRTAPFDTTYHKVTQFPAQAMSNTELLYDLMFDGEDVGPYCYTVTDGKVSMLVASEAPSRHVFPATTAFILGLLSEAGDALDVLSAVLTDDCVDLSTLIAEAGAETFAKANWEEVTRDVVPGMTASMAQILSSIDSRQELADAAEVIIGSIGLQLVSDINCGWRYDDAESARAHPVLAIQMLRIADPASTFDTGGPFKFIVGGTSTVIAPSNISWNGPCLASINHHVDASRLLEDSNISISVEDDGGVKLVGRLFLTGDAGNPIFLALWDEQYQAPKAMLMVRFCKVSEEGLRASESWGLDRQVSFGRVLGGIVGQKIVEYCRE